jgi:hypothetical protein
MRAAICALLLMTAWGCDDAAGGDPAPPPDMTALDAEIDAMVDTDAGAPDAAGMDAMPMPDMMVDAVRPDAALPDLTEAVYADDHLLIVSLEIDPADWDTLRVQSRGNIDRRGEDCLGQPFESPYTWFSARVTVDGQTYENVGVRKKGFFGSVSSSKPSLKIRLDKYVDDQLHEGVKRITLNNQRQDPSIIRSCLAYRVFERAGVPVPRCNFAHLFVNGRDFGVYAHVESLKKPWLRRHFDDEDGYLYEGTLSDFRPEYRGTIEQKTDEETPYTAPIDAIADAVQRPDDELIGALEAAIDLDRFFRFWVAEVLTTHWDGYSGNTNNFWFYDDPTSGKVVFIPWGPDATFTEPRLLFEGQLGPWSVMATGIITRRLYMHPEGRARYLAEMERQLNAVWDPAWLRGLIDTWVGTFGDVLRPNQRQAHAAAVAEVATFVQDQAVRMRREVRSPAEWEFPLRGSFCQVEVGTLEATMDTTWGSWPTQDAFQTGSGTLEARFGEERIGVVAVGGAIGPSDDGNGVTLLQPVFTDEDALLFVFIRLSEDDIRPGEVEITPRNDCSLNFFNRQTRRAFPISQCPEGRLTFEAASMQAGAPVRATYTLTMYGDPEDE